MSGSSVHMVCQGCGFELAPTDPFPFRCPRAAERPQVDHVLVRRPGVAGPRLRAAFGDDEPHPFLRYRQGLLPFAAALEHGLGEAEHASLVRTLDARIEAVDGAGFRVTPLQSAKTLAAAVGLGGATLWVKDETDNVSGSHKARHLMGIQLWLEIVRRLGWSSQRPPLAIASCGNAALAAAVVARAAGERLQVFVPVDAEPSVVARLQALGAEIQPCPRLAGERGDPCMHAFHAAVAAGALPYGCQGNENGMTLEGGRTLGYEIVDQLRQQGGCLDHLVVQVGGGALASSLVLALRDAHRLGLIEHLPRIHTVQTAGGYPLHRAWSRLVDHLLRTRTAGEPDLGVDLGRAATLSTFDVVTRRAALRHAATHRRQFMWAWETAPHSIASGILDDETYDWLLLVDAMIETGGVPLVAPEPVLKRAHELAHQHTPIDVCPTGSSGLAGVLQLHGAGAIAGAEQVGVVFSGRQR